MGWTAISPSFLSQALGRVKQKHEDQGGSRWSTRCLLGGLGAPSLPAEELLPIE